MNTNHGDRDDQLHSLLSAWKIDASLPPRFEESVWRRIGQLEARSEGSPAVRLAAWLQSMFRRPASATAFCVILLLVGLAGGLLKGEQSVAGKNVDLSARYLQSVDPYLAVSHGE